MNFCEECENYLNLQVKTKNDNSNELIYVCRNCQYQEKYNNKNEDNKNFIYKNHYDINSVFGSEYNTDFLEKDNTLPRVNNITCPNVDCPSNQQIITDKETKNINEVVYIVVNKKQMIFQYKCCNCNTIWKNR